MFNKNERYVSENAMDTPFDDPAETEGLIRVAIAYLGNPSTRLTSADEIKDALQAIREGLYGQKEPPAPPVEELKPAVPIKRSVFPDYIICLEDGKQFKSLKRYLMTAFGMTPDQYREKWGLPHDYPMVAPNYAAARSELAKKMGLGRKAEALPPAATVSKGKKPAKPASTVN